MAGKGKLNDHQKTFVVQSLACFDNLTTIKKNLKADYGVDVSIQAIECYDPNKRAGANLAKKWRAIFEETRNTFLKDTSEIGISHRAVRLRALQRMAEKAEASGNMVLAASLLEQAAKEVGNSYTNRRELAGAGGGPIKTEDVTTAKTEEELIEQAKKLGLDPSALGLAGSEETGE